MAIFVGTKVTCSNPHCEAPIGTLNTELNWGVPFKVAMVNFNEGQQVTEGKWPQCVFCKSWWFWGGAIHTEQGWRKG